MVVVRQSWAAFGGALVLAGAALSACAGGPRAVTSVRVASAAAPPGKGRVTYLVGGDSRGDRAGVVRWAFSQARTVGARGFIFLGDMEWSYGCDPDFEQKGAELLAPVPLYPVVGNHEVAWFGWLQGRSSSASGSPVQRFQRRFLGKAQTPVVSAFADRVAYALDLENGLHFVALDNVSGKGFGREQLEWLGRDLARARSDPRTRHIVVGMHKPLAGNCTGGHSMEDGGAEGRRESDEALALFAQHRVTMILASHVHQFAQFRQRGIPTYITGGLGAHLRACSCGDCQAFHHLLQLDVGEDDIKVIVVGFPGAQLDGLEGDDDDNAFPDLRCAEAPSERAPVAAGPALR